ncbi:MAG TPA: DNA mismatch repair endonuclease MutL [Candidatus Scatomorpha merdigallinarum]|nr:DNA mismatch repair endonuclease MutL [Candidatus Scatomorpha merdigallinarum]
MPRINILSPHVADLIAAGEVVERPASAVKELLENAIDAGARNITVEFSGGGAELIRITDDGCGMSAEDAGVAFLRHATSKLHDERGLESIGTLGFRGEALAAISSVSHIELTTCEHGAAEGTYMSLDAGDIQEMRPAGAPEGTSIAVRGLFYNTPARRKFLKSDRAEGSACLQAALRCALGRPDVSIRCIRDGREEFFTPGDGRAESAVYSLLGRETALAMLPILSSEDIGPVTVTGFTGTPGSGRGSRSAQYFFVNGRHIKSQLVQAAVEQAYKGTLLTGKYPACVIYLNINPSAVDVNVHPAKTEVKFSDERAVFNAVHYAVLGALEEQRAPVQASEEPPVRFTSGADAGEAEPPHAPRAPSRWSSGYSYAPRRESSGETWSLSSPTMGYQTRLDLSRAEASSHYVPPREEYSSSEPKAAAPEPEESVVSEPEEEPVRVIGEALGLYILAQQGEALVIIDKHAAHERMLYDALVAQDAPVHSQTLLTPATLTPDSECAAALETYVNELESLGFEYENFGRGSFIIRAAPATLSADEAAAALEEAAEELAKSHTPDIANARAELLKTVACKAAIKAGPSSEPEEIEKLARAVCSGQVRYCPHGRPVAWVLTRKDLDKQFKRIV